MPRPIGGYPCVTCGGERLHVIGVRTHDDGRITRVRECTACQTRTDLTYRDPASGVVCPGCSHTTLPVVYTRHRQGCTVRVRQCQSCERCVRTVERFESLIHASKGRRRSNRPFPGGSG